MKRGKSLKNKNNIAIFSQKITPIRNYIIKGDINPEHEIQAIYLKKLLEMWKPLPNNKYRLFNSINPSLTYIIPPSENITNFTGNKKQQHNYYSLCVLN